jgi:arylsulfatase
MEGKSLVPILKSGKRKGHEFIGFEHFNEKALMSNDGWKIIQPGNKAKWELYNLNTDRSEQHNLAEKYPDKVAAMVKQYESWAKRSMVLPSPN